MWYQITEIDLVDSIVNIELIFEIDSFDMVGGGWGELMNSIIYKE